MRPSSIELLAYRARVRQEQLKQAEAIRRQTLEASRTSEVPRLPGIASLPLVDVVPTLTVPFGQFPPGYERYERPTWFESTLCRNLDRLIEPHKGIRYYWFSGPRNHGKTVLVLTSILKHLAVWPDQGVAYFTNAPDTAAKQSNDVRRVARTLGFQIRGDVDAKHEWELETGGGLFARAILNARHGRRFRLIIVDDPFVNFSDARNAKKREKVKDAIDADLEPMLHPDGAVLLCHARQHAMDAIGHFSRQEGWEGDNVRALEGSDDRYEALYPKRFPVEALLKLRRKNEQVFVTQYQGEPTTLGGKVFRAPTKFTLQRFRPERYEVAYGIDCAASDEGQARGDWSVIVKMIVVRGKKAEDDLFYVMDVIRVQKTAPEFLFDIKSCYQRERGKMRWYRYGMEKAVAQFFKKKLGSGVLTDVAVQRGHYGRAMPYSEAWNEGRVLTPGVWSEPDQETLHPPEWGEDFESEHDAFTGTENGVNDDQVDAAAAAFDQLDRRTRAPSGGPRLEDYMPALRM